ncbi:beta-2 adrenergic receptor-like [Lineus longissimus]|uniref:beta-2 adrenergic receptor-like n=1 Tax=Lineus longissimus TaxID=88925 RepID=UPI00315D16EB
MNTTILTLTSDPSDVLIPGMLWAEFNKSDITAAVTMVTIKSILILCIFFGNGLVLIAFCRHPKLRRTLTNYLLASLAAADILIGVGCICGMIVIHSMVGFRSKHACLINIAVINFGACMSIIDLLFVALDRLVAIRWPLRYPSIITKRRVLWGQAGIVVLLIALTLLHYCGLHDWDEHVGCFPIYVSDNVFALAGMVAVVIVLCIIVGIYVYIFLVAKSHFVRIVKQEGARDIHGHRPSLKDLKAAKMLFLIMAIFIICWGTSLSISIAIMKNHSFSTTLFILDNFGYSSMLLSSALNPLVYAFRSQEFRLAFGKLLRPFRVENSHLPENTATTTSQSRTNDDVSSIAGIRF